MQSLLDEPCNLKELEEAHEGFKAAYESLEKAHENYAGEVDENILEEEGDYLLNPSNILNTLSSKVKKRIEEMHSAEKSSAVLNKFRLEVEHFGKPSELIEKLSQEKKISLADMRIELSKIEASYDTVKSQLMLLDPASDAADILDFYQQSVVAEVEKCKSIALTYMKDIPITPTLTGGGTAAGGSGSGEAVTIPFHSSTKRETVMLPHFSGDEKTAYLKYPIWKEQWDNHIKEYEVKYRATMLLNHLDDKAQLQIVGLENDYDAAIAQLDSYYIDA